MPYIDDIWDWSGTDVKVVNATVVLEGVSVITAEASENAIEPLERADVELLLPIQILSREEEPTVSPLEIVDFSSSSIECAFDVTTQQAEEVVRGVLCGTTNPPTFENADYRLLHGQGGMDLAFAGLHPDTEYYLRPYALSNLGYKYGDVVAQRTKTRPIPDEYQLVEYIQSNGYAHLDLGVYLTDVSYSILDCIQITQPNFIFYGYYIGSDSSDYRFFGTCFDMYGGRISHSNWNGRHIYELGNFYIRQDGVLVSSGPQQTFALTTSTVWLFGVANYSSVAGTVFQLQIFNAQYSKNYNFYPVRRLNDNIAGLYDIINNVFVDDGVNLIAGPDKEWEE